MAQPHRSNHTTSVCYLDRFVDPVIGKVVTDLPKRGARRLSPPASVGYRNYFWGKDPEVREEAERRCGQIETAAAHVLAALPTSWPLKRASGDWWALVQFLALHLVRSPAWREDTLRRIRPLVKARAAALPPEQREEMVRVVHGDAFIAELTFEHLTKVSTILAHLNWALVRFPAPMLLTSDQPLAAMPFMAPNAEIEIGTTFSNMPANLEFRFAVDPEHVLLLSWVDQPDPVAAVELGFDHAVSHNAASVDRRTTRSTGAPALTRRSSVPRKPEESPGPSVLRCSPDTRPGRRCEHAATGRHARNLTTWLSPTTSARSEAWTWRSLPRFATRRRSR